MSDSEKDKLGLSRSRSSLPGQQLQRIILEEGPSAWELSGASTYWKCWGGRWASRYVQGELMIQDRMRQLSWPSRSELSHDAQTRLGEVGLLVLEYISAVQWGHRQAQNEFSPPLTCPVCWINNVVFCMCHNMTWLWNTYEWMIRPITVATWGENWHMHSKK